MTEIIFSYNGNITKIKSNKEKKIKEIFNQIDKNFNILYILEIILSMKN